MDRGTRESKLSIFDEGLGVKPKDLLEADGDQDERKEEGEKKEDDQTKKAVKEEDQKPDLESVESKKEEQKGEAGPDLESLKLSQRVEQLKGVKEEEKPKREVIKEDKLETKPADEETEYDAETLKIWRAAMKSPMIAHFYERDAQGNFTKDEDGNPVPKMGLDPAQVAAAVWAASMVGKHIMDEMRGDFKKNLVDETITKYRDTSERDEIIGTAINSIYEGRPEMREYAEGSQARAMIVAQALDIHSVALLEQLKEKGHVPKDITVQDYVIQLYKTAGGREKVKKFAAMVGDLAAKDLGLTVKTQTDTTQKTSDNGKPGPKGTGRVTGERGETGRPKGEVEGDIRELARRHKMSLIESAEAL